MFTLKRLIVLAFFGSLLSYGVGVFVYFICGLLSFSAGFFLFLPEIHWVSLKQKVPISRGLVDIEDNRKTQSCSKRNYAISGCRELDVVLNQILDYIIDDYVRCWYSPLTSETEFPAQLHGAMANLLAEVSKRAQRIDWVPFMIEGVPNMVIEHLRIHRKSLEKNARSKSGKDQVKFFFEEEYEMEQPISREAICTSPEKELEHLRKVTDVLLFAIMPEDDYRLVSVRYLLKEIIVNGVLLPTINLLSDPDFVNQSIIKLGNESAFASPYFIQSLRMSTSEPELRAVKERIDAFAVKLRGRDSGGDDDAMVKAQLNSLNFLENICNSQVLEIRRGPSNMQRQRLETEGSGIPRSVVELTFEDVMANDVAVSSFLEFLTTINKQSLLSLYLNCVAYRVNSEELMTPITSSVASSSTSGVVSGESDVFNSTTGWDENPQSTTSTTTTTTTEEVGQLLFDETENDGGGGEGSQGISPQDRETMEGIRAFGVSMCNLVMRVLPEFPEEAVQRCLRSLTTPLESIDPTVFLDVEEELIRLLSSESIFGEFRRSAFYSRALEELANSETVLGGGESPRRAMAGEGSPSETEGGSPDSVSFASLTSTASTNRLATLTSVGSGQALNSSGDSQSNLESTAVVPVNPFYPDAYTVTILSGDVLPNDRKMVREGYVVYTLEVVCYLANTGRKSIWRTYRRYSQFDDLHSCIIEQCGRIPQLKLPGKKSFSNVSAEFIERRRSELDDYLQTLCSIDTSGRCPKLHPILASFLQPEKWERKKVLPSGVSSIMNPLKVVGSAIISVPDTLMDGFSKIISRRQTTTDRSEGSVASLTSSSTPSVTANGTPASISGVSGISDAYSSSNLAILDQTDSDNIPFRLFFQMVDEVFSLHRRTQLFRRGILAVLRNITQTFFGDIMNRRIVEKAKSMISAKQMARYATMLRDVLWPNGSWQHRRASTTAKSAMEEPSMKTGKVRDEAMKLRTRVLCRAVMFGSVAEELASYLGGETTREGVARVFALLQQPRLNRRLVHRLLEAVLRLLLSDCAGRLSDVYAETSTVAGSSSVCSLSASSS